MFLHTYASARVKRNSFYRKSELRICFCWFPTAILVHLSNTQIWRLQTKLYKVAWNILANTSYSETVGHKDLRLGQIVCIHELVFFNISFSWLLPLDSPHFYTYQLFLRYKREIFILEVLGFLKTTRSFPKIPEEVRSLPKAKLSRKRLSTKSEIARKVLSFIHFTHGFRSLHGSELTYFWKLCQARRQQLTFFNQAWEIGPQAWAGVRSKFSTRRRETHA